MRMYLPNLLTAARFPLALALLASLFTGCSPKAKPVTDTVKWFNTTYALLTTANQADVNLIGGYEKNAINQKLVQELLDEWWDVTDRATAGFWI